MSKFEEMLIRLNSLTEAMQACIDNDDFDGAEVKKNEIQALRTKMDNQAFLDSLEMPKAPEMPVAANAHDDTREKEGANFIRACIKKFSGKKLTEAENSLLLPTGTGSAPNGEHGEGYILPEDIRTKIKKRIREFRSLRSVCGSLTAAALTGSYPVENIDSLSGLVDFTDGDELEETTDFSFGKVKFSLREKGAIISLSNTLLALSDNDLLSYIIDIFAKKAVITENAMAVEAITKDKNVKTLANWQALKSSINKDLDPVALHNTVIVTNQDGFDFLDSSLDETGRPILQPDVTNPTVKKFMGYPVHVFSNSMIKTTASKDGYAPVYYGSLEEGVKFVELNLMSFATSKEAGFTRNLTYARLIEFIDVIQNDSSDRCYCVGQFKVN